MDTAMQHSSTPYTETGKFSRLVLDYLAQRQPVSSFFGNYPDAAGFKEQLRLKQSFSTQQRQVLVNQLHQQYKGVSVPDVVNQNIEALANSNTFTITTGHQLCLFSGPLYTVYKILHVVALSRYLADKFPEQNLVPVFWLASEDHDFDEVNHAHIAGKKLQWQAQSGNGVGRISTEKIASVIEELQALLPNGERAEQVLNQLRQAYAQPNLAQATRYLVNTWFGQYGVMVVDGDDAELKRAMIPAFTAELKDKVSFNAVSKTNQQLGKAFKIQVTPREINLFYLNNGLRNRIEKTPNGYSVVDSTKTWSNDSIFKELNQNPEHFSPNVLLRPLYQETILPNVAYIGGGGEVAYWAQLKDMFAQFGVPFPIVVLRQSVQIAPKRINRKRQKLNLSFKELFEPTHVLTSALVKRTRDFNEEMAPVKEEFEELFSRLEQLASSENADFKRTVLGHKQYNSKRLAHLEKRLHRSAKTKNEDQNRMLEEIKAVLMPNGGLQERKDNIVPYLAEYGQDIFDEILHAIDPLAFRFITLYE